MPVFDVHVVVDWSAAATPKLGRDSIWCAAIEGPAPGRRPSAEADLVNLPTRAAASAWLGDQLARWRGRRVLAGFDFSFGYPAPTAATLGLDGPAPWEAMWEHLGIHLLDDERNRNNRFAVAAEMNRRAGPGPGPLWGCPPAAATSSLTSTKPADGFEAAGVPEYRLTERAMRAAGHRVFSGWQLLGAGSVGSQTLTGVPVLQRLRRRTDLDGRVRVWPFEFGPGVDDAAPAALAVSSALGADDRIVFAEVWPGSIPFDPALHPVRDAAQVIGLARHLAALDAADCLLRDLSLDLAPEAVSTVFGEEGWILGGPVPRGGVIAPPSDVAI